MQSDRRVPELRRATSAFIVLLMMSVTRLPRLVSRVRTYLNLPSSEHPMAPITSSRPSCTFAEVKRSIRGLDYGVRGED